MRRSGLVTSNGRGRDMDLGQGTPVGVGMCESYDCVGRVGASHRGGHTGEKHPTNTFGQCRVATLCSFKKTLEAVLPEWQWRWEEYPCHSTRQSLCASWTTWRSLRPDKLLQGTGEGPRQHFSCALPVDERQNRRQGCTGLPPNSPGRFFFRFDWASLWRRLRGSPRRTRLTFDRIPRTIRSRQAGSAFPPCSFELWLFKTG